MKTFIKSLGWLCFAALLAFSGCAKKKSTSWSSYSDPVVTAQMKSFVTEKEAQANAAVRANGQSMPPELNRFFKDADKGDWTAVNSDFKELRDHAPQYEHSGSTDLHLRGTAWAAVVEIWGVFDAMSEGGQKYSTLYANEIINSIPPGSIYFGGTDPGRFLITGMEKNQAKGDPFYLITQNALADDTYLDYVRSMYGKQLYIPTMEDSEKCFRDYTEDAKKRAKNHQLKPGENVQVDSQSGRVAISGEVAVMEINGLIAKVVFDQNSNEDFYVEQSFPLDWMYPYLEPHGMILKLDRHPLPNLSDAILKEDRDYWSNLIQPMIGNWLIGDTSVQQLSDFVKKTFRQHDFTGFSGDPQFFRDSYACKMFSKERASIAELYLWRMGHATNPEDKQRMAHEADFAFKQALALWPQTPEAVSEYKKMLTEEGRDSDASVVTRLGE
ncbi:MAG TPA: hypothetical protein VGN23_01565 [Verrucomicrobiae bacterium]|jgi:hypothetical protein